MDIKTFYKEILDELKNSIRFLEDKPEETLESTLNALWFAAAGTPVSADIAVKRELPMLDEAQKEELKQLVRLRLNNVPLAHITKRQNFLGIELLADKRALIPRKETEILGKKAFELSIEIAKEKNEVKVFDLCCGSGNLGVAIAKFNPKCIVFSSDLSSEAVELTRENISFLKLNNQITAIQSDVYEAFRTNEFFNNIDLIICNPPYISTGKVEKMDKEISLNEPTLAFDGGMLGIKVIQKLVSEAPLFLAQRGWLIFEVGVGQGDFVIKLIERTGDYHGIASVFDDSGNIRVVLAQKGI